MPATRISYLNRLVSEGQSTWNDFDIVYKPLLRRWLQGQAISDADIEDIIQEVMLFVANHLHRFDHNQRTGAFRKWLRSVTVNITRNYLRKQRHETLSSEDLEQRLGELEDDSSRVTLVFEQDYQRTLMKQVLQRIERGFSPKTISMFHQHVLDGASVQETAASHRVSKAAVYVAKSKVMRRLREEWAAAVAD
jgi:RNA polymerase sigma-70 factor (ECF subfamily)